MPFDDHLAERVRRALSGRAELAERKMFGGLAFMVRGHMCCGIVGSDLMVRVGADRYDEALARPHARVMDFTGRPLMGMVYVGAAGVRTEPELRAWTSMALAFVESLPAKLPARPRPRAR
jgi:hypothetical protein